MKNNRKYNLEQLSKLEALLSKSQKLYKVDLHLHTTYSADGTQTVEEAILRAKQKGFNIISITDHDSIGAYEKIFDQKLNNIFEDLIIIPGVEFTVNYPEYEGRCHVLKYFFDLQDLGFRNNLLQNKTAYNNRIDIWFQRIKENDILKYFMESYNVFLSVEEYKSFLSNTRIAEYATLMEYIFSKLAPKGINVWDVYNKAVNLNNKDDCVPRRIAKELALQRFYTKYKDQDISQNYRKLRPILAPVGIDDNNYPKYKSSSSLSVNEFGQINIKDLNNSGINILAHPDNSKLYLANETTNIFDGLEINFRSRKEVNKDVLEKAREISSLITIGSDSHDFLNNSYDNMDFYCLSHADLEKFVLKIKEKLGV